MEIGPLQSVRMKKGRRFCRLLRYYEVGLNEIHALPHPITMYSHQHHILNHLQVVADEANVLPGVPPRKLPGRLFFPQPEQLQDAIRQVPVGLGGDVGRDAAHTPISLLIMDRPCWGQAGACAQPASAQPALLACSRCFNGHQRGPSRRSPAINAYPTTTTYGISDIHSLNALPTTSH